MAAGRSHDQKLLKTAVAKGLLSKEEAQAVFKDAGTSGRAVATVLTERGLMAARTIKGLEDQLPEGDPSQQLGGFTIRRKLGKGGMGTVYEAVQQSLDRTVALKLLPKALGADRAFVSRFQREARAAAQVNHPNVITIHEVGSDNGRLFMALELVQGGDCDGLVSQSRGKLPEARALEIFRDATEGLDAIYKAGLIHRDIKPANILLTEAGNAKLADLGLARSESGEDRQTMTGQAVGTPAYMSPEQARGVDDLDIRSDIYALGATLFALLCGRPPFTGSTAWAVVAQAINEPLPDPRQFRPELRDSTVALIQHCMAKARDERPANPEAVLALLAGKPIVRPTGNTDSKQSDKTATDPTRRRWAVPVVGAAAVILVLALVVGTSARSATAEGSQSEPGPGERIASQPQPALAATADPSADSRQYLELPEGIGPSLRAQGPVRFLLDVPDMGKARRDWSKSPLADLAQAQMGTAFTGAVAEFIDEVSTALGEDSSSLNQEAEAFRASLRSPAPGSDPAGRDRAIALYVRNQAMADRIWNRLTTRLQPGPADSLVDPDFVVQRSRDWLMLADHANPAKTLPAPPPRRSQDETVRIAVDPQGAMGAWLTASGSISLDRRGTGAELALDPVWQACQAIEPQALDAIPAEALAAAAIGWDGQALARAMARSRSGSPELDSAMGTIDTLLRLGGMPSLLELIAAPKGTIWSAVVPGSLSPALVVSIPRSPSSDLAMATVIRRNGGDELAVDDRPQRLPMGKGLFRAARIGRSADRWFWCSDRLLLDRFLRGETGGFVQRHAPDALSNDTRANPTVLYIGDAVGLADTFESLIRKTASDQAQAMAVANSLAEAQVFLGAWRLSLKEDGATPQLRTRNVLLNLAVLALLADTHWTRSGEVTEP